MRILYASAIGAAASLLASCAILAKVQSDAEAAKVYLINETAKHCQAYVIAKSIIDRTAVLTVPAITSAAGPIAAGAATAAVKGAEIWGDSVCAADGTVRPDAFANVDANSAKWVDRQAANVVTALVAAATKK